jgi:hypothetical protein
VQWSKKAYPFTAQLDPVTAGYGRLTGGTSMILPLAPGTWYYRVRGFDYNLPTGAQAMAWSQPEKIVVARPKYRISSGAHKRKFKIVRGKG